MSRPNHLSCPNTAEGIRRINEAQENYDKDPEGYEEAERAQAEQDALASAQEAEEQAKGQWEAEQQANADAEAEAQAQQGPEGGEY